ncbi:MAG: protein phosphatase 2C domain-containing protein [Gammaproteobacteria bacterium]|nr:protein phosphatase 2C domain-containing protein [Gammaproteobacteria bacterium]
MNTLFAGLSDVGLIRKNNEDSWYADTGNGLFIVADGMGGHHGGEVASGLIVEHLPELIKDFPPAPDVELTLESTESLKSALVELNSLIYLQGLAQPGRQGMGATAVVLLVHKDKAIVGHVGDSRLYILRDRKLVRITHDHSITQYLVDLGEIQESEAANHAASGQISQYLGMKEDPVPDMVLLSLEKDDRLLMCSDGLNGMLDDQQITEITSGQPTPRDACEALVKAAKYAGGKDNITTIVVDILG